MHCIIHKVIADKTKVFDVDALYLYKKAQKLEKSGELIVTLDLPSSSPIFEWEIVSETNFEKISQKVPCVTNGTVYTYLAQQTTQADGQSTFRPLAQGYCMGIGHLVEKAQ